MKTRLSIDIYFDDESDVDWIRQRAVPAVEDIVAEAIDEGRMDGQVDVSWDVDEASV